MKFGRWFWGSFVLTVVIGIGVQQRFFETHVPIIIQMPAPPAGGGSTGRAPQNPCHSMSQCN